VFLTAPLAAVTGYGLDHKIWEEHKGDEHRTCEEWLRAGHSESFRNGPQFPNGECMRFESIGLVSFWTLVTGAALCVISLCLWVFSFVAAGDACERVAARFFRAVVPEQRILVLEVFRWLGIRHGKIKVY